MSDALFETDFSKMNHKQLCEKVEELYAIVAKFKRLYNWQMENIDMSNLGKGLNSTMVKTDGAIKKVSNIEQTAEEIKSTVEELQDDVQIQGTTITQHSDSIELQAKKNVNELLKKAITVTNTAAMTNPERVYFIKDASSVEGKGTYYLYNEFSQQFEPCEDGSIMSTFRQTADGFRFDGSMIVDGSVQADRIIANSFTESGNPLSFGLVHNVDGKYFQSGFMLCFGEPSYDGFERITNQFGVLFNKDGNNEIDIYTRSGFEAKPILGHSAFEGVTYPKGTWNFDSCEVVGLGLRFT